MRLKAKFNEEGEDLGDFCPCCNFPHEGELFPLCCKDEELAELGSGFTLYYSMAKWLMLMLLITLIVAGGYCLYRNYTAANMTEETLKTNWIMRGSLANYGDSEPSIVEPCLHVGAIFLLLVLHAVVTVRHEQLEAELDKEEITPSDYAVIVENLSKGKPDEGEFRAFLEKAGSAGGRQCTVAKVNWTYHIANFVAECSKLSKLKERLGEIRSLQAQHKRPTKTCCGCFSGAVETEEQYTRLIYDQKEVIAEKEAMVLTQFAGVAIVIFSEQDSMRAVKRALGKPKLTKNWQGFLSTLFPCRSSRGMRKFNGQVLQVKRAPDPSDIIWENLGVFVI